MFDDGEINNILHAGLVFILFLFVAILLYYMLSYPLDLLFNAIDAGSVGTDAADPMAWLLPNIQWGLNVAFALSFAFPIVWIILWVFKQEPDFSMFRR
jgi:hypothetical protein